MESSKNTEFQISISGDLNEDEQNSLKDLLQQMQKVGQAFFQGDSKRAFNQAQKMGFDTEQIAGFSMSLNMEKSIRAVSAYQQVSEQYPVDNNALKQAGDFYNQAAQALAGKTSILQLFPSPSKTFDELASGIADIVAGEFNNMLDLNQHTESLKKLFEQLGDADPILSRKHNATITRSRLKPSNNLHDETIINQ